MYLPIFPTNNAICLVTSNLMTPKLIWVATIYLSKYERQLNSIQTKTNKYSEIKNLTGRKWARVLYDRHPSIFNRISGGRSSKFMLCVGVASAMCADVLASDKDGGWALLCRKVFVGPVSETTPFSPPPPTLLDWRVETILTKILYLDFRTIWKQYNVTDIII